ncbi:ATP-binding protein [Vibrio cyclitrophicus]|nr:ATP-binding protein [Vibrio cyclitrophicus]UPR48846.1 ATP-binding protein [Vibrio cyclitrophicus]
MIKSYKFKNFQSYLDETNVDLTVSKKSTHSYFDYEQGDGSKISKVMCVFGANGSGKSNLLKPLAFASWFLTHSFRSLDKEEEIPIIPHFANSEGLTEIEIDFIVPLSIPSDIANEFEYRYSLALNETHVEREELKIKSPDTGLFRRVFSRELIDGQYVIKKNNEYVRGKLSMFDGCPKNCSMISYLSRFRDDEKQAAKAPYIILVAAYFNLNASNLTISGRDNEIHLEMATEYFDSNPESFEKVKSLLRDYDLGVKDIEIANRVVLNETTGKEEERLVPLFVHSNNNEDYEVPIWMESNGTQTAYYMLAQIIQKLDTGGVAILDEFDNDLHPLLTLEILDLFKCSYQNKGNAQLIFTTHTPQVLDVLRKQHCYLVEKEDSVSDVWRIDQIEGIKERDNLYSKYINGLLGGVPEFD